MNASYVPSPREWSAATWHARQNWANARGLTMREAVRAVAAGRIATATLITAAGRRFGGVYPPAPATTDAELAASHAGDRDPIVVAMRRAAATGLALGHPQITRGLSALGIAS